MLGHTGTVQSPEQVPAAPRSGCSVFHPAHRPGLGSLLWISLPTAVHWGLVSVSVCASLAAEVTERPLMCAWAVRRDFQDTSMQSLCPFCHWGSGCKSCVSDMAG